MGILQIDKREEFNRVSASMGLHLANLGSPFTAADLRDRMEVLFPEVSVPDDRALGAVMRRLRKEGFITPTGRYVENKRRRNHNRPLREWVGIIREK